jgi:Na+/H+ antiporter NhaD/arsenite permease-like protein
VNLSLIVVLAVFILIAVRQIGHVRFQIWQIMTLGAVVVLLGGEISPANAWNAINLDIILFLFGMFVVGQALEESGYLAHLTYGFFKRARTRDGMILMVLFGGGLLSALLMNDTVAIVGTPVVLLLGRKHAMRSDVLLLALAFAVTTGSVMSPIGNPQNLLIALHGGIPNPFLTFLRWLLLPTLLNLYLAYLVLKWLFPDDFHDAQLAHSQEPIRNHDLSVLSRIALHIVVLLVIVKIVLGVLGIGQGFLLTHIALGAALPIVVGSPKRWRILSRIDWTTLVFFAAMFVVMESLWDTGLIQQLLQSFNTDPRSMETVLLVSVVISQVISNVPLVALLMPLMRHAGVGVPEFMALAAGSTIAGNLMILGAASNVIIVQKAERHSRVSLSFLQFARAGIPLTIVQTGIYWLFLRFV